MLSFVVTASEAQQTQTSSVEFNASVTREVNLTSDSTHGWLPSKDLKRQLLHTIRSYFRALDDDELQTVYAMFTELNKQHLTYQQFVYERRQFRDLAGPVRRRLVLKITWTKDPDNSPYPGVYAAVDFASKFANVDRSCGYLVVYQSPAGGDFQVMRTEDNYIDNATAREIVRTKSQAELETAWLSLSANCPD